MSDLNCQDCLHPFSHLEVRDGQPINLYCRVCDSVLAEGLRQILQESLAATQQAIEQLTKEVRASRASKLSQ